MPLSAHQITARIPLQSAARSSLADSCALRSTRSAALTVHRTVIHYRRLRFAYLGGSVGRCRASAQNEPMRSR